jgi:hypothetical protein
MDVLVATSDGLYRAGDHPRRWLAGRDVTALHVRGRDAWVVVDGRRLVRFDPTPLAPPHGDAGEGSDADDDAEPLTVAGWWGPALQCVHATAEGDVLAGTAEARLVRLDGDELHAVTPFDGAPGRDGWYTPWGGPPDVRAITSTDGAWLVAVHVGGILRSDDGGTVWRQTIDVDDDVHEVRGGPGGLAVAAASAGLATSYDGGATWSWRTEGLHATYCRAVAVAGDAALVSASTGPNGGHAALYRAPLAGGPLERCVEGLPEWFDDNVDTGWVDGDPATGAAALVTPRGRVLASDDAGRTWNEVVAGLPPPRGLALLHS